MRKAELIARLEESLAHLETAAGHSRLPKALREEFSTYVAETTNAREAAESRTGDGLWRIARAESKKTGREVVLPRIRKDGLLTPGERQRTGLDRVDEWVEVRADSQAEAQEKIAAGEGTLFRQT